MKLINNFSKKLNLKKILLVVSPLIICGSYFYILARTRYTVNSELVIRKASDNVDSSLSIGGLLGSGNLSSREDAKFLQSYLKSPQLMEIAEEKINFSLKYKKNFLDPFAGISNNSTKDDKYNIFRKIINVYYNESSNILTIKTFAFDPNTAYKLNKLLIENSEYFANSLNQDIFKKQLKFVRDEVEIKASEVDKASNNLIDFQRNNIILDPKAESLKKSSYLTALESELVKLKIDLAMLKRRFVKLDSPEIIDTTNQILELSNQIKEERLNLVNPRGDNLNLKILKVSDLENKLKFALDLYKAAITTYEKTRINSLQQQRFIAVISKPTIPEKSNNNWRHRGFLSVISSLLLILGLYNFFKNLAFGRRD